MRLEREPHLAESRYRDKLASGRIRPRDVEALLVEQLGTSAAEDVAGVGSRPISGARWCPRHSCRRGARALVDPRRNRGIEVIPHRSPARARSAATAVRETTDRVDDERQAVRRLWNACLEAVRRVDAPPVPAPETPFRHRDWLLAVHDIDTDAWIHSPLIRFLAGYLDQGLAHWSMPERDLGIHGCFLEIYRSPGRALRPLGANAPALVADDYTAQRNAVDLDRTFSRAARCR